MRVLGGSSGGAGSGGLGGANLWESGGGGRGSGGGGGTGTGMGAGMGAGTGTGVAAGGGTGVGTGGIGPGVQLPGSGIPGIDASPKPGKWLAASALLRAGVPGPAEVTMPKVSASGDPSGTTYTVAEEEIRSVLSLFAQL